MNQLFKDWENSFVVQHVLSMYEILSPTTSTNNKNFLVHKKKSYYLLGDAQHTPTYDPQLLNFL